ncbi:MAG: glycerol-3-phosphate acyltransferase [Ruminococcus sp.]|nr:glycerol-3-phosphate acyltransferase [Ruminococcus sp.]
MIMGGELLVIALLCYVAGGINGAIIMSKLLYHEDIRKSGSNNPGFTNFKRVYGLNAAAWSVLLIDILKTALPVFLSAVFMSFRYDMWQFGAQFAGLFCMLGHCFPVWYGFKGGKAFIAGFATIWFVDWRMTLIAMAIFFLLLFTLKYMSVASCTAALSCPISLFYLGYSDVWVEVMAVAAAALVIVRHYPNFVKLVHGTESKFSLSSKH